MLVLVVPQSISMHLGTKVTLAFSLDSKPHSNNGTGHSVIYEKLCFN